ncbi:hypothetical protein LIER_03978 [Lithospermum erythrorhizon]|uniref:Uncharacterized protein n=1 Tax=Lithospermum erythrorhizon TaxID=34254 RepID=A0AAV3NVT8_LITER
MEEATEDFVGSLLRDSPEAPPTTTFPDLDDSQAPLTCNPFVPEWALLLIKQGLQFLNRLKGNPPRNLQP